MGAGVATKEKTGAANAFASADEMREVLTELLETIERDTELGGRLRSAQISYRYVFTDVGLTLDIASSDDDAHRVQWSFSEKPSDQRALTLEMTSEVANSYLQGRENLAIAVARGRIRFACTKAKTALSLLPISREISECYREVLRRSYPQLLLR